MKESKKIGLFLFLYTRGELSPAEQEELFVWRNQDPENEKLFFQMTDPDSLHKEMQDYFKERDRDFEKLKTRLPFLSDSRLPGSMTDDPDNYSEIELLEDEGREFTENDYAASGLSPVDYWGSMISDINEREEIKPEDSPRSKVVKLEPESSSRKLKTKRWVHTLLGAAACATVIIFQVYQKSPKSSLDRFQAGLFSSGGVDRAFEDISRGFAAGRAGIKITDNAKGEPIYIMPNESRAASSKFYMLKTPADGEFILQLPDSTLIWLNGSSAIKYPANFNQRDIVIEISGEVYVERSKDAFHHYIIMPSSINGQLSPIQIPPSAKLDISNYPDNEGLLVTLISGDVGMNGGTAEKGFHFSIGKQVVIINDSLAYTQDVNASEVTSWRNGTFYYRQTSILNIMPAIAKWYEMDVQYPFGIPDKKFNLRMDRNASVTDILDNLKNQGLHVTHLGKNITIWK
jgi:ferric-dicitrate binding protein FerR (iron transport regulator)